MKKYTLLLLVFLTLLSVSIVQIALRGASTSTNMGITPIGEVRPSTTLASTTTREGEGLVAEHAKQLVEAYPDFLMIDPHDSNAIVWKKDDTRMQFDDGVLSKDLETLLSQPDLEDQTAMPYVAGDQFTIQKDSDPGRVRVEAFFKKMYGTTEAEVRANLETISWLPRVDNQPLLVTRVNGVNQKLQAISNELDRLIQQPRESYLRTYLTDPAGTWKWRNIAGTERLSPHSFGIAIDINTVHADYWQWTPDGVYTYHNQIPMEIVKVFEKYGFIWGGKWYHYDTMHFEYRPELLLNQ